MLRWWWIALVACGSSQTHDTVEREPAWADAYAERARVGCTCKDPACLDKAHADAQQLEAAHGGLDDAPPAVQVAHAELDKCWRAGTKDLARDLEASANELCGCTTPACVDTWKLGVVKLDDKYGADVVRSSGEREAAALARMTRCHDAVTIPAAQLVALVTKTADAMCACDELACAQGVMKQRADALANYLAFGDGDVSELGGQQRRFCGCLGKAVGNALADALPLPGKVDLSISCK